MKDIVESSDQRPSGGVEPALAGKSVPLHSRAIAISQIQIPKDPAPFCD